MVHFLRSGFALSLLIVFGADAVMAQSTNKVVLADASVDAGQQGAVTISLSNDLPMTLLNFDLMFDAAFCGDLVLDPSECVANGDPSACCTGAGTGDCGPKLERLPNRVRLPEYNNGEWVGYVGPISPQEGGQRCPTEGKMSFIFLDGSFSGAPIVPKCTCFGDANKDGFVNVFDTAQVKANFFQDASPDEGLGDANCDGFVNVFDTAQIKANFFQFCAPGATGGPIARWVFDVRSDATPGSVPISVAINDATNGPVVVCETGGVINPPTACSADIGSVGATVTIN